MADVVGLVFLRQRILFLFLRVVLIILSFVITTSSSDFSMATANCASSCLLLSSELSESTNTTFTAGTPHLNYHEKAYSRVGRPRTMAELSGATTATLIWGVNDGDFGKNKWQRAGGRGDRTILRRLSPYFE